MSEPGAHGASEDSDAGDDLVRFFHALPADARREYASLAELDRRFGEDPFAEVAATKADR